MVTLSEVTLSLLAGSLSTLNPCVFPLLPLVLGGAMQNNRLAPMAMGLGMASSFAILGVLIGLLGDTIGLDTDLVRAAGGWLLVLIGLAMWIPALNERVTRLMTPLASNAQGLSNQLNTQSLISAFALGGVLGFVWSPCSGPLLLSAITLVATEGGLVRGGLVLGLFGLGAAIPHRCSLYHPSGILKISRLVTQVHGWHQKSVCIPHPHTGVINRDWSRQEAGSVPGQFAPSGVGQSNHKILAQVLPNASSLAW